MTPEDVRIIFNNVAELAKFSDDLTGRLEGALGSVLEGGVGEDHVGSLFLEIVRSTSHPAFAIDLYGALDTGTATVVHDLHH